MNNIVKILKSRLPDEIAATLAVKKFSPGEVVIGFEERSVVYLQKGMVISVIPFASREYIFPHRFKPGDVVAFHTKFTTYMSATVVEFRALTEVEAVVFPEDLVRKYLMTNLDTYSLLSESGMKSTERISAALFIQLHGGARALLAYMLSEYSYNGDYPFMRYENIANCLSISRTMLYKLEKEFTSRGLIRKERKRIVILDIEGLRHYYRDIIFKE